MANASPSKDLAVRYALQNKWKEAYLENKKLLGEDPNDTDTLNRLAYSLIKLGKFKKAKIFYKKVIKIDKTNPVALKNLIRLDTISKRATREFVLSSQASGVNLQDVFIEEAGKTRTVELKNIADKKTLSMLQPGDSVILTIKRSKIFVQMRDKTFIGMLPDSIGMRMVPLINGGNEYSACIKSLGEKSVAIFIKETKRMSRFKNYPSFINPL